MRNLRRIKHPCWLLCVGLWLGGLANAKTYDHGRNHQLEVRISAAEFSGSSGHMDGEARVLRQRQNFVKNASGGRTDTHHWGVWSYLTGRQGAIRPENAKFFVYGAYEDFVGKGRLKVYVDLEIAPQYASNHFLASFTSDYMSHCENARRLSLRDRLLRIEVIGNGLRSKSCWLGYRDLECHQPSGFVAGRTLPVSKCYLRTDYDRSLLETTGDDPKRVEFRIEASSDLVQLSLHEVTLHWSIDAP